VSNPYSFYAMQSIEPILWKEIGGTNENYNQQITEIIKSNVNPTINENPSQEGTLWANYTTNEIFMCTDNTTNKNIWQGNKKTIISEKKIYTYDIFYDLTSIAFFQLDDNLNDMGGAFHVDEYNTTFENGKIGKCLKMNFTNSKFELYGKLKNISFWAYFPETMPQTVNYLFDCRGYSQNYYASLNNNCEIGSLVGATILINGNQVTTGYKIQSNQWIHISINFNGDASGTRLMNSYTQTAGITSTKIDHLRAFNRALTSVDISTLIEEI
jgi:hypothetical protein